MEHSQEQTWSETVNGEHLKSTIWGWVGGGGVGGAGLGILDEL